MPTPIDEINNNIRAYKRKYYTNTLIKGVLLTLTFLLSAFLVITTLEFIGNFSPTLRGILFFSFVGSALLTSVFWVIRPAYKLINLNSFMNDEEAAKRIGSFFPEVRDKLVNVLQLNQLQASGNALAAAGISRKTSGMQHVRFTDAVQYENNRRYLLYLIPPFLLLVLAFLAMPEMITESTTRIVQYDKSFEPQAPFKFLIQNSKLQTFKNEDFTLKLGLEGSSIPSDVYLNLDNGRRIKMEKTEDGSFSYEFNKVQKAFGFEFSAAGFNSASYEVSVLERPNMSDFFVSLSYPAYTGKSDERLENTGNVIVPQGTRIEWNFKTRKTENLFIAFENDSASSEAQKEAQTQEAGIFSFSKRAMNSSAYRVKLKNEFSDNKEEILYYMNVIPDEYPSITLNQYQDSALYDFMMVSGSVSDDYGISKLALKYKITDKKGSTRDREKTVVLEHNPNAINQQYFHQLNIENFDLKPGESISYYVQVWDNDAVNGRKSSRTGVFEFALPDKKEFKEEMEKSTSKTEDQIDKALEKSQKLQQQLKEMREKLSGKKKLSWQDQKALKELLKKHEELQKEIEQMSEQNQMLDQQRSRFNERDKRIAEKSEQLQKLMDEMLDEETKKLYEELQKLLDENADDSDIQEQLEDMEMKEENLEKDLERALEMFKQMKFENKLEDIVEDLKEMAEEQKDLSEKSKKLEDEKTESDKSETDKSEDNKSEDSEQSEEDKEADDKSDKKDADKSDQDKKDGDKKDSPKSKSEAEKDKELEEIKKEQEELKKKFDELKKDMEELEKMNEDLKNPNEMEDTEDEQKEIEEEQKKSSEQLEQKDSQKASESQKKAGDKMEKMAQKMEQMQSSMAMQQMQENYDDLRQILENLMALSFEQEEVMDGFREVEQEDPQFISLSQRQLKLQDDAKIVEDSLRALAERVFQIQSFVTRELADMNDYMDQSVDAIKKRKPNLASGKQQFTMTSMNNLALLLSDVMDQMQQSMGQMMSGSQMCNKPGGAPKMSEMQQQLNQQIQQLKKSGKSGKGLSKELAKLAAEQARIRRAMKGQMEGQGKPKKPGGEKDGGKKPGNKDGGNSGGGGNLSKMLDEMEKTEEDLVNKRLTQELIERQKKIMTRLLEAEKAERERGLDEKRESESAKKKTRSMPPEYEAYLKEKEKQIELLKTIPASLSPYYKKEVNEYFKKIK